MIIPAKYYSGLPSEARDLFLHYAPMLYDGTVVFNMPDSDLHAMGHCERVLFHAIAIGATEFGDTDREALEILAHAAVFHDTRRQDEYLDTGHGARAAVYYKDFCCKSTLPYHEETALLMRYHDLDDSLGREAIMKTFDDDSVRTDRALRLYAIFKDADALDRWRLGRWGLDVKFLRTPAAKSMVENARQLVHDTMDHAIIAHYDRLMDDLMTRHKEK